MPIERQRVERRTAFRAAAATAVAVTLTVLATSGVAPDEPAGTPPVDLSFVSR